MEEVIQHSLNCWHITFARLQKKKEEIKEKNEKLFYDTRPQQITETKYNNLNAVKF